MRGSRSEFSYPIKGTRHKINLLNRREIKENRSMPAAARRKETNRRNLKIYTRE